MKSALVLLINGLFTWQQIVLIKNWFWKTNYILRPYRHLAVINSVKWQETVYKFKSRFWSCCPAFFFNLPFPLFATIELGNHITILIAIAKLLYLYSYQHLLIYRALCQLDTYQVCFELEISFNKWNQINNAT